MINSSIHTQKNFLQISPEVGMQLDFKRGKLRALLKENYAVLERKLFLQGGLETTISIERDISVYFHYHYDKEHFSQLGGGIGLFF